MEHLVHDVFVFVFVFVFVTIVEHLVHDVFELHHGDADKLVVATEAVVLDADVQLVGGHLLLVADDAEQQEMMMMMMMMMMLRNKRGSIRVVGKKNKVWTYKWKVSLNFGDQLPAFCFVWNFLFLSARCGPDWKEHEEGTNGL